MKIILAVIISLITITAHAYIPPYWMIMSRVAENHGEGVYRVTQDVTFYHGPEPLTVTEVWTIKDEEHMRVEVYGKDAMKERLRLSSVYKKNRKYTLNNKGKRISGKVSGLNPTPYFHFRKSVNAKNNFVRLNIAPTESLKSSSKDFKPEDKTPIIEPYVRLARLGGVVNYAIGSPSSENSLLPGAWIQQDQFDIRKIRFNENYEITASDYKRFTRGLRLPLTREILWKSQNIRIEVSSVNRIVFGKKTKAFLQPRSLLTADTKEKAQIKWPDDSFINEFYTELR